MLLWIILAVVAAVVVYAIVVFNRLVRTRQMANEAWSGIDVQLKRRSDLVPNLVETVKGYAAHERAVLEEVTAIARRGARAAGRRRRRRAQAEGALSAALGRLFALAENYPDLKASANFLELQQQLSDLENELQMARRYYNGAVRNLNVLVQSFPSNLIAGLFGFAQRDYFELRTRPSAPRRRSQPGAAMSGALAHRACLLGALARRRAGHRRRSHPFFRFERQVAKDGELTVTETLRVQAEGSEMRHGIYRDFPLTFRDAGGTLREVTFSLLGVTARRQRRALSHRAQRTASSASMPAARTC